MSSGQPVEHQLAEARVVLGEVVDRGLVARLGRAVAAGRQSKSLGQSTLNENVDRRQQRVEAGRRLPSTAASTQPQRVRARSRPAGRHATVEHVAGVAGRDVDPRCRGCARRPRSRTFVRRSSRRRTRAGRLQRSGRAASRWRSTWQRGRVDDLEEVDAVAAALATRARASRGAARRSSGTGRLTVTAPPSATNSATCALAASRRTTYCDRDRERRRRRSRPRPPRPRSASPSHCWSAPCTVSWVAAASASLFGAKTSCEQAAAERRAGSRARPAR